MHTENERTQEKKTGLQFAWSLFFVRSSEFKCLHLKPAVYRDFNFWLVFFMIISSFLCTNCCLPYEILIRMKWNRSFNKRRSKYLNRKRATENRKKNNSHFDGMNLCECAAFFSSSSAKTDTEENENKKQLIHADSVYKLFAFY